MRAMSIRQALPALGTNIKAHLHSLPGIHDKFYHCSTLRCLTPFCRRLVSCRRPSGHATIGSAAEGSSWMDQPETQVPLGPVEVFPRLKERDPYRLLGVDPTASPEEVIEAADFLETQYGTHAESKERIMLAKEKIIYKSSLKHRLQHGMQLSFKGRKDGGKPRSKSVLQRIRDVFEPDVSMTTVINDGSIFLALAAWAGYMAATDPSLPVLFIVIFCAYKMQDKRVKRDPEAKFWGGSPWWGAIGTAFLGLALSVVFSRVAVQFIPVAAQLKVKLMFGLMGVFVGCTYLFVR